MAEELRMRTIIVRTDPFQVGKSSTVAEWEDVLTFVRQIASLAQSGKKIRLVETKGKVTYTVQ